MTAAVATGRRLLVRFWAPLVLVFAAFAITVPVTSAHSHAFSPIDEWVYYDYLQKFPSQGIVHQGEPMSEESLRLMSCQGVQIYGRMGEKCSAQSLRPELYPFDGITTADTYTPAYFAVTWVGTQAIKALGVESTIFAARLTSSVWLAASMVLFWALLRQFRVRDTMTVALGLCFMASPVAYWTYTFMGTDVPTFGFGCALLLTAHLVARKRIRGWWLVILGVIATMFKVTNITAVGLAALYLLLYFYFDTPKDERRKLLSAAYWRTRRDRGLVGWALGAAIAAVLAQISWLAVRAALAVGPIPPQQFEDEFNFDSLGAQTINFINGTLNSNVFVAGAVDLGYPLPEYLGKPLQWICVIGVLGALIFRIQTAEQPTWNALRWSVATTAVLAGPLLALTLYLSQGFYFFLPSRYGLPLAASFLLMFGAMVRQRYVDFLLFFYGLALLAWMLRFALLR